MGSALRMAAAKLVAMGLPPTHVLWMQGESDYLSGTDSATYDRALREVIREVRFAGVTAPFYVGLSTRCFGMPPSVVIRAALLAVARSAEGARLGADTDMLDTTYRYDTCHMTANGLDHAAALWLNVLRR